MALRTGNGEMQIVLRVKDDGTAVIEKFGKTSEKALGETTKNTEETSFAWKGMGVAAGTTAAAAAVAAAAMIKSSIDIADATLKTADTLGLTTEAMSALVFTADLAGVSQESLSQNLLLMTRNLSDAANGMGQADGALRKLNLNAAQLTAMAPEQAFAKIADALENVKNKNDRVNIAMDIFGRSGAEMIKVMKGGAAGLKENADMAERFGQVISTKTAREAEIFNDNLTKLKAISTGAANQLAAKMLPTLIDMTNQFLAAHKAGGLFYALLETAGGAGTSSAERVIELKTAIAGLTEQLKSAINAQASGLDKLLGRDPVSAAVVEKLTAEINTKQTQLQALEKTISKQQADLAAPAAQNIPPGVDPKAFAPDFFDPAGFAAQAEEKQSALFAALGMENELLSADYIAKQDMANNAYLMGQISQEQFFSASALLEQQHQEKLAAAQEAAANKKYGSQSAWISRTQALMKGDFNSQLQGTGMILGQLAGLMGSHKKKDFDLGKKAAIANAYVQTYLGMARALGEGGPFMGPILAAIMFKLGMMNVQNIKSQEFGGGAGGGAIPTYAALPGTDLPQPDLGPGSPGNIPPPTLNIPQQPRTINLTVESDSGMVSLEWLRNRFAPVLNEALGDGLTLNIK